jgi:ABC-type lipoprotein release transport system permease subunit
MNVFTMAWRNLLRNKRRTALAATSLFFAIAMVLFMGGFVQGFLDSLVRNSTKNDTGHVNVATEAYRLRERFMPVDEYMPESAAIVEAIRASGIEGVAKAVERVKFGVIVANGDRSKFAMGIAGDPELERSMLMLDRSIVRGSYLAAPRDMILGEKLAQALGYGVGDTVRIVTTKVDGGTNSRRFTVSGIFKTGVNALDLSVFQVSLDDARALLGMEGGCTQVLVMLDDYAKADESAAKLSVALRNAGFQGLSAMSWTTQGDWARMVAMMEGIYAWMYLVIALLGAFIIANVIMMAILERRREIGILKSMGMRGSSIFSLFLVEGAMIGAIGGGLGGLAGFGFNALMSVIGLDMTSAMAGFTWPMDNVVYPTVDPAAMLVGIALGVFAAAVVSALPALKAAKMEAVDAIKGVA